jgi:hypothetical protein
MRRVGIGLHDTQYSEVLQDGLPSAQQFRYIEVTKAIRRRRSAQSNNERPETI